MTVPVWVEQQDGTYTVSLIGATGVTGTGPTMDAAVAALRTELTARRPAGQLVFVDLQPAGWLDLAEKYEDDPDWRATWDEISAQAYRERDEEKARELPE